MRKMKKPKKKRVRTGQVPVELLLYEDADNRRRLAQTKKRCR